MIACEKAIEKARRSKSEQKEKRKAYAKAYRATPEYRAKNNARKSTAEYKAKSNLRRKAYRAIPENMAAAKALRDTHEYRAKKKARENTMQFKEWRKKYMRLYKQRKPLYSVYLRIGNHLRRARKLNATIGDPSIITRWIKTWRNSKQVHCYWCNDVISGKRAHADHIMSLAGGGSHTIENLCISCAPCNHRKHSKTMHDWNQQIAQPVLL